jgi:hypothetical protein
MADARLIERVLVEASRVRRRLSLEEVLEAGLPAVYQRYGDRLLFTDGRIFDASDPEALAEIPLILADGSLETVGLEFGWKHAGDCPCHLCTTRLAAA